METGPSHEAAHGAQFWQCIAKAIRFHHNKEPDYAGQLGYVQATVLFEAIARAADKGTLKKGGVVEELRKINLQTPIGRVQFNDKGDNTNFVLYMAQHQNGKIVIVWPSEA